MKKSVFTLLTIALAGCAATGVQVSEVAATQFKEGVTSQAEITAKLGQPTNTKISGGKKTLTYAGAQCATKAATFVPIVGLFAGGMDCQVSAAEYEINEQGILVKMSYTTGNQNTGTGILPANQNNTSPSSVQ